MLDVRDPAAVLVSLREAEGRFEQGGPVPVRARALLGELAEAISSSGPLEMGVSPRRWLKVRSVVVNAVGRSDAAGGSAYTGAVQGEMKRLERFFRTAEWSARWAHRDVLSWRVRPQLATATVLALWWLLFLLLTGVGEAIGQGRVMINDLYPTPLLAWLAFPLWVPISQRTREGCIARATASGLELPDRLLWACRPSRDMIVLATDQRLLIVPTDNASLGRGRPVVVSYDSVTRFTALERSKGENTEPYLVLECGERRHDVPLKEKYHARALLALLEKRSVTPRGEPAWTGVRDKA